MEKTPAAFIEIKAAVASNLAVYHRVMAARSAASQEASSSKRNVTAAPKSKSQTLNKKQQSAYA